MQKRNKFGRFVKGLIPWNTGLTKETDEKVRKIAEMKIGKKRPDMVGNQFRKGYPAPPKAFKKGHTPWNKNLKGVIKSWCKGLTKETSESLRSSAEKRKGRKRPEEVIRKGVETRMKNDSYKRSKESIIKTALKNTGKKRSEKTKKKMRLAQLGTKASEETRKKMGKLKIKYYKEHPEIIEEIKKRRANQVLPFKDSSIEIKIQNFLKSLGIEFFTHQKMNIKHSYQCDILIPSMNLVIECDGDFIHCNPAKYPSNFVRFPNSKNNQPAYVVWDRDKIRTKELLQKGFEVLRLWEFEINEMSIKEFANRLGDLK